MGTRRGRSLLAGAWFTGEFLNQQAVVAPTLPEEVMPRFLRELLLGAVGCAVAGVVFALAVSAALERLAARLPAARASALRRGAWLLFAPAAVTFGSGLGVLPQVGVVMHASLFATAAGVLALRVLRTPENAPAPSEAPTPPALYPLFFGSGLAALIYQVVWQRTLFALYGANVESTTMVVATFMLGLGLGGLLGGALSARYPRHAAHVFLAIELGIGAFGLVSLPLIRSVGLALAMSPSWLVSLSVVLLLVPPTTLMGATLPVLVGHLDRELRHVGRSVSVLYAINTAGSALACFLTVDLLFVWFGQSGAVLVAAACNLAVGALVFRFIRATAPREAVSP